MMRSRLEIKGGKGIDAFTLLAKDFQSAFSDRLLETNLEAGRSPRDFYIQHPLESPPPLIAHSDFISSSLVEHLMRNKKNSALAVKFIQDATPPDSITNMEGLLHTYITPVLLIKIHGDYRFRSGHGMVRFFNDNDKQQARQVILSAAVQPDFEDGQVMIALSALGDEPIIGQSLSDGFSILDTTAKQDRDQRTRYDTLIRSHIIAHLLPEARLPALKEISSSVHTVEECCHFIENIILQEEAPTISSLKGVFVRLPVGDVVVSAQLLGSSAFHQARNEIAALDLLCVHGYVYTSDPPSIFAREIGAKLLNRFQIFGLKCLVTTKPIRNMEVFAFNDYADPGAMTLLECVFKSHKIRVMPKKDLFSGKQGAYSPNPILKGALLVIHNNSDGFGQNVETEFESSLDGVIGVNSSAAASLKRDREDLTDFRLVV